MSPHDLIVLCLCLIVCIGLIGLATWALDRDRRPPC